MDRKLQNKLYKKYPKIFRQKDLSMEKTAMCWGISIGNGWYWLIDKLCSQLQWDIDKNHYPQIETVQVKEKFGGLRFYTNGGTNEQNGMISLAESLSFSICEDCGTTKDVSQTKGWIVTLCKKCYKKRRREIKENV